MAAPLAGRLDDVFGVDCFVVNSILCDQRVINGQKVFEVFETKRVQRRDQFRVKMVFFEVQRCCIALGI